MRFGRSARVRMFPGWRRWPCRRVDLAGKWDPSIGFVGAALPACTEILIQQFLHVAGQDSLFPAKYSLFFKIFSLLICVGNYAKTACSAAVSCSEIVFGSLLIAIFPVKFPISREFAWRRV